MPPKRQQRIEQLEKGIVDLNINKDSDDDSDNDSKRRGNKKGGANKKKPVPANQPSASEKKGKIDTQKDEIPSDNERSNDEKNEKSSKMTCELLITHRNLKEYILSYFSGL